MPLKHSCAWAFIFLYVRSASLAYQVEKRLALQAQMWLGYPLKPFIFFFFNLIIFLVCWNVSFKSSNSPNPIFLTNCFIKRLRCMTLLSSITIIITTITHNDSITYYFYCYNRYHIINENIWLYFTITTTTTTTILLLLL